MTGQPPGGWTRPPRWTWDRDLNAVLQTLIPPAPHPTRRPTTKRTR